MKRTILIGFTAISLLFGAWESIGPFGGPLRAMAVAPNSNNIVYVATYSNPSKIYISIDAGSTWTYRSSRSNYVYCLAVDPVDPDILYAGSNQCVYKTTNGGYDWTTYSVSNSYIYEVAIHPTTPAIVCAAGRTSSGGSNVMGFFKSTNSGSTWSATPLHTGNIGHAYTMTIDSSEPDNIYIGGYLYNSAYYPKIYKSTDGGSNFNDVSTGLAASCMYMYSLAVHPSNSSIVYAGSYYGGIYRTTNSGGAWSYVNPGTFVSVLGTTADAPNTVYAGTDTIIYKSTDAGANWYQCGTGYGGRYKYSRDLVVDPLNSSVVYTVDNTGCCKSTDSGSSWFDSNYGMALASIACFSVAPSSLSTIYTEFEEVCTFKTTNSGEDWTMLPATLECGSICEFAIDYTNPDIVLALEGTG